MNFNVRHQEMSASTFALLIVMVLLLAAVLPVRTAAQSKTLFATDIGLVLLPAPAFMACLATFNEPAQTGWATIGYPFLVLAVSVAALFVRVYALPPIGVSPKIGSLVALVFSVFAAAAFGAFVGPWYE